MQISFYNLEFDQLKCILVKNNFKQYLANQLFNWVYKNKIIDVAKMTNIKLEYRNEIKKLFTFATSLSIVKIIKEKETIKFLFKLFDNNIIETVIMIFNYGCSVCISTQVGCNMSCSFCASSKTKKIRNLEINEIVLQIIEANDWLIKNFNMKITNIVVMGIGEPFDNFNNLLSSIRIITNKYGMNFGPKHITVSTCGICDKIIEFGKALPNVNLAISLHATNDKLRSKIMPINNKYNLHLLINTCKKYISITNNRLTFEYILIDKINDTYENAMELIALLKKLKCYVNLIPYNETHLNNFKRSKNTNSFFNILNMNKIKTTIRLERGKSIDAACGQLRIKHYEQKI